MRDATLFHGDVRSAPEAFQCRSTDPSRSSHA